jgi:hypothetical protein
MKLFEALGYTPAHMSAVDAMDKNFTGSQFDYAAASTKDMVDRASNPFTSVVSAIGNVAARPAYDFVDAAKEYGKTGYQGEFGLTPQGLIDFGKNLGAFGGEFLNQQPHIMMAGALKGSIESLGTQLGEGIYGLMNKFRQDQFINTRQQTIQEIIRQAEIEQKRKEAAAAAAANAAAAGQRRAGRGGSHMSRSRDQGGLGISRSQAQSISDANRAAGMSGWNLAEGGIVNLYRYGGFI